MLGSPAAGHNNPFVCHSSISKGLKSLMNQRFAVWREGVG